MNRFCDIDCSLKRLPAIGDYKIKELVSLEKALESIQTQILDLNHFIKIAKHRCHFPSEHHLTRDESAAIYIYTMECGETSFYRVLNKALCDENRNALKIWFSYLKLFDSALDKLPTVRGNVWRGVSNDIGKNFTKNQKITWWTVNSCSSSSNVIEDFLGNKTNSTMFLIKIFNGKKISGYTDRQDENEIILKMGTDFCVQNDVLEHPKGSFHVHLVEINAQQWLPFTMNDLQIEPIHFNRWKQNGQIVAGGNGEGQGLNQLACPYGIFVDRYKNIFIADYSNERIVQWKSNENQGKIVAGENRKENGIDSLNGPTSVIVDEQNHSLIIADSRNSRVIRWFNQNQQEILIENIECWGLAKDKYGFIYVCDLGENEVRRWRIGEKIQGKGTLVAGGNGQGDQLNQLNSPHFIFVDDEQSIYISDQDNHRVMKWRKDAREGIVVAGGNGEGDNLNQLNVPQGILVDDFGQIYIADCENERIMRWCEGKEEGEIIVGGKESNQFHYPYGLSFDVDGNLYVADSENARIKRFDLVFE